MKLITVRQSQAHLLLEAINQCCGTVKINVEDVAADFSKEIPETEYKVHLDIDRDTEQRINGFINANTPKT